MERFELFGLEHWLAVTVTVALGFALPWLIRAVATQQQQALLQKLLGLCLVAYLVGNTAVRVGVYNFSLHKQLPLHLCGASMMLGALMLWFRSYRLYEVMYFWGTAGALAAILTPDLNRGFPHPLFVLFFLGHGLAFTSAMFATIVWDFRPRLASVPIALAATAAYAMLIIPVNIVLGSNYLYLRHKPNQPSVMDYLGPWPWYILGLAVIAAVLCVLFYLPFVMLGGNRNPAGSQQ